MSSTELAAHIFGQRNELQRMLDRKAGVIFKTWRELEKPQRSEKLTNAGPGIPTHHRPDVEAFDAGTMSENVYGLPFINIDDLVKGDNLLFLLSTRGRSEPHELVHSDFEAATFLWRLREKTYSLSKGEAMRLHGQSNSATYGKLVSVPFDFFQISGGVIFRKNGLYRPEVGRQIMKHQAYVLDFLVKISKDIISSAAKPILGGDTDWEAQLRTKRVFASLGEFSTIASYQKPSYEHLTRLNEILKSERDSKEDQVWALREDPGVFCERIKDEINHNWEGKPEANGQYFLRPISPGESKKPWATAAEQMVKDAYTDFALFDDLATLGEKFVAMAQEYDSTQWQDTALPKELLKAYWRLKYILDSLDLEMMQQTRMGLVVSPPLRSRIDMLVSYTREDDIDRLGIDRVKILSSDHAVVDLMKLVSILYDPQRLPLHPLHILMDALDNLIEGNQACHDLLSSWVTTRLSNLSVIAEYQYQLKRLHPWICKADEQIFTIRKDIREEIQAEHIEKYGSRWEMSDNSEYLPTLDQLADPSDGKFHYPKEKLETKETVEACCQAESKLDMFWKKFDLRVRNSEGENYREIVDDRLEQGRTIQRTPAWSEPEVPEPRATEPQVPESRAPVIRLGDLVDLPPAEPRRQTAPQDPQVLQDVAVPANDAPAATGSSKPKVPVDWQAKVVFDALFHSPTARGRQHPGEIKWDDFIYAMSYIGFSGCKLRGSVWRFDRQRDDGLGKGSLNVHEPHPSRKCSFAWMRREGRRLTKRWGWTGETFGLKIEKD